MTGRKRQTLPLFLVVPDVNVLFSPKPDQLISGGFEHLWSEISRLTRIELHVPEIVLKERLHQLIRVAEASLENAKKNVATLGSISSVRNVELPTIEHVVEST